MKGFVMSFFADKRKRKIFIVVASIVLVIAVLIGACAIYLGDYYKADDGQSVLFCRKAVRGWKNPTETLFSNLTEQ